MQSTSGWSSQLTLWTVSWTINDHYLFSLSLSRRKFFSPNSFKLCFCLLHIYRPPNWNMFKLTPPSRDFNEQMGGRSLGDMSINAGPGMSQCEARQSRSSALPWLNLNLCNGTKGLLKLCFHWAALGITLSFRSFHFWRISNLSKITQCKPRHVTMRSAAKSIFCFAMAHFKPVQWDQRFFEAVFSQF